MSNTSHQSQRILVVEDENDLRELVVECLEGEGWDVLSADSGEQALEHLRTNPNIGALFTDIRLPGGIDGWSVAEEYRALHPNRPVLYATGYSASHTPVSGSMFFRKPYKLQQIVLYLKALAFDDPKRDPTQVSRA